MTKKNSDFKIENVKGDVIITQGQQGGITAHEIIEKSKESKGKSLLKNKYVQIILGSIVASILGYFGIQPKTSKVNDNSKTTDIISKVDTIKNQSTINKTDISVKTKFDTPQTMKNDKRENKNEQPSISIKDVNGNVIISQNQTGGITAHTVINNTDIHAPEYVWYIKDSSDVNIKNGDHYSTAVHLKIDSKVPVQKLQIRAIGKAFYRMDFTPLSGASSIVMTGQSGKTDWGFFETLINAFGEYKIVLDSKEREQFTNTTLSFGDR